MAKAYTLSEILSGKDFHRQYCFYCEKIIESSADLTKDHIIPKSKGGSNKKNNIVISCKHCNNSKASRTLQEFMSYVMKHKTKWSPGQAEVVCKNCLALLKRVPKNQ